MEVTALYQLFLDSNGICTDTRKIEKGTIFFALKGDNFNGNEYASRALEEGCSYAVVDEPIAYTEAKIIQVTSVLKTLQDLANYHRIQFDIPVLGITGSNGKTTTKELIGAVLNKKYNVLMTEGNFNNYLGVPFTLLRLNTAHEIAIIEMGASVPGDIEELVKIAEPDYAIITNIGAAHIEGFGSIEGVIETKTALYRWIENDGGMIFYNADDSILKAHLPDSEVYTYGEEEADIIGELEKLDPFVHFKWSKDGYQSEPIKTNLVGKYNFTNFLAAVAIGNYFEVKETDISEALQNYVPSNNRSQVQRTEKNTLIVDCYNANATSMKAAVDSFLDVDSENKLAILGDMLELGNISQQEHQKIVNLLTNKGVHVILVGAEFAKTEHDFQVYSNFEEVIENASLDAISDHLILLKGSRGIRLENLIPEL